MIKIIRYALLACIVSGLFGFSSVSNNWVPILMKRSDFEKSIKSLDAKGMENTGKFYFYQSKLFIVEKYKGLHVIDNSDPSKPENIKFIQIPGCMDISTKGNFLLADNAVDLVAIDIADLDNVSIKQRLKGIFPEILPPNESYMPEKFRVGNRPANTVIVSWRKI